MAQQAESWEQTLESFRSYLAVVGRVDLDPRLHAKIGLSDVIQVTLLEAHQNKEQIRNCQSEEQARWVRRAFANNLMDEIRKFKGQGRDVRRERSIDEAIDQSSLRLQEWLAVEESSPNQKLQRQEVDLRVAEALATLREPEREAVILQHWHGWTLAQIGERLDRTPGAVAGLLHRGLEKLKKELQDLG